MSAPAGSYSNMGSRNVMNEPRTMNPDVNQPQFKQTGVTAGAAQSPVQAASEGYTLNSTNNANMSTGHPYNQTTTDTAGAGHPYGTGPAQSTTGDGVSTCGDNAGKNVHGAFKGIHGVGEVIRGNMMSAVDRALGNNEGAAKNAAIAEAGRQQMRGFSGSSQPNQKPI